MDEASKPGLSDEKAARMMVALRAGQTLRKFGVKAPRLEAYFKIHPDYAREARPLLDANKKLAFKRKADRFRAMTHCVHGHPLSEARIRHYKGWTVRDCLRCEEIRRARGGIMRPETLAKVKFAFERGGTVSEIIHGRPIGGGPVDRSLRLVDSAAFYRYRRENLEFDRFIAETIAKNNSRGQQIRYARERTRAQTAARRHEANDYGKIRALFPANFPGRDDVVSDIFEALLSGSLKREDVKARVKEYMAAHNRMFPTDFAKFGDGRLVSLDVRLFEDGAMTLGDTISRGLWD